MLTLSPFKESMLLAGNRGLNNKVLNATLFDAPDGHSGCRQGDFIISTGYPIMNNQDWEKGLMTLLENFS